MCGLGCWRADLWRRVAHRCSTLSWWLPYWGSKNGAVLELTGQNPSVVYGPLHASDSLTSTRNASEDKLVCSGEFEAADLRIAGTSTTVADLIGEVATLKAQMAYVLRSITPPPASPPPPSSPPSVPPQFPPPPATFILLDTPYTWAGARTACQALGRELASIHSNEETAQITSLLIANEQTSAWIGLHRQNPCASSWQWTWADQTPLDFTKWRQGEPNGSGCYEPCVSVLTTGFWNNDGGNAGCDWEREAICRLV